MHSIGTRWLGREDSNLRMAESKSAALPLGDAPLAGGPNRGLRAVPATPGGRIAGQTVAAAPLNRAPPQLHQPGRRTASAAAAAAWGVG